ncbi:hypothetical protein [Acaryochloris sp. CCMEE 5410]|uniref:hypothetical protein n=1 Tax=Acaryochloris sp. CCMEE 5410 TaxID=310037 RepID=UPI0002484C8F|nr:hypothetical protein [Acaryochloris sp. CCMEE 5410]KAI9130363.1 hypothetical protein ON05_021230 [Acaryochloris sp. CCMEE 5410]
MNQTPLNAIALFVALLSGSILVGPILHIAPEIPFAFAALVLALVVADTFGYQGKGMTLFLDGFARLSPQYRQRVIHHEAGHFLTAYLLDLPITGYTLTAWEAQQQGGGQGGICIETPVDFSETSALEQVERYCTVWMAGGVAETFIYSEAEGGKDDLRQLRRTLNRLHMNVKVHERQAGNRARQLIRSNWDAYEALVQAMTDRKSVADCCQILEQHCTVAV